MSKLAEIFDVEPITVEQTVDVVSTVVDDNPEDSDYELSRAVQRELIEQGRAAINTAMRIAAESEQARSVEVLATMMKTVSDMNAQLLGLAKTKNDIKATKSGKNVLQSGTNVPQIGTQNILHIGSASDINSILAARIKDGSQ